VRDKSGRLVDDDQILIFENHRESQFLGFRGRRQERRDVDYSSRPGRNSNGRLRGRFSVERDMAILDEPGQETPAMLGKVRRESSVESFPIILIHERNVQRFLISC
jgi:hypothetical protein